MDDKRFAEKYFLTENNIAIRQVARTFAQKKLQPHMAELDEHNCPFPGDLLKRAGELGLLGITRPEEYGGLGLDTVSHMIMMEELSKVGAGFSANVQCQAGLTLTILELGGTEEQKKTWLADAIRGEKIGCFGLTEPESGSDSGNMRTHAELDGDEWVLNGQKCWTTNMTGADFFVIACKTDPTQRGSHGISVFYVPRGSAGLTVGKPERKLGSRCSHSGCIYLDNVRVPKENLLGEEGQGFKLMMRGVDAGRLGIAAISIGIAQDCYDRAVRFSKSRIAFGKPICEHEAIAFYLADMAMEIDLARTMLYNVCRMKDAGLDYNAEAAAVKVFASQMCVRTAELAIQIHGGNGYSEEYVVERHWRDSKLQTIGEGTTEICKIVMSRRCIKEQY